MKGVSGWLAVWRTDLLLEDLHDWILNVVAQLGLLEAVLEVLLGCLEILTVGVGSGAEDLHKTEGELEQHKLIKVDKQVDGSAIVKGWAGLGSIWIGIDWIELLTRPMKFIRRHWSRTIWRACNSQLHWQLGHSHGKNCASRAYWCAICSSSRCGRRRWGRRESDSSRGLLSESRTLWCSMPVQILSGLRGL